MRRCVPRTAGRGPHGGVGDRFWREIGEQASISEPCRFTKKNDCGATGTLLVLGRSRRREKLSAAQTSEKAGSALARRVTSDPRVAENRTATDVAACGRPRPSCFTESATGGGSGEQPLRILSSTATLVRREGASGTRGPVAIRAAVGVDHGVPERPARRRCPPGGAPYDWPYVGVLGSGAGACSPEPLNHVTDCVHGVGDGDGVGAGPCGGVPVFGDVLHRVGRGVRPVLRAMRRGNRAPPHRQPVRPVRGRCGSAEPNPPGHDAAHPVVVLRCDCGPRAAARRRGRTHGRQAGPGRGRGSVTGPTSQPLRHGRGLGCPPPPRDRWPSSAEAYPPTPPASSARTKRSCLAPDAGSAWTEGATPIDCIKDFRDCPGSSTTDALPCAVVETESPGPGRCPLPGPLIAERPRLSAPPTSHDREGRATPRLGS